MMKKFLLITTSILLAALIPFTCFFFLSRDYAPPQIDFDEDFYRQNSGLSAACAESAPQARGGDAYGSGSSDVSKKPGDFADEIHMATLRDIIEADPYRDSYDPDDMLKKPKTGTLSANITVGGAAGDSARSSAGDSAGDGGNDENLPAGEAESSAGTSSLSITRQPSVTPDETQHSIQTQPPFMTSDDADRLLSPAPAADPPPVAAPVSSSGCTNPLTGESFDRAWNPWNGNLNKNRPWVVSIGNTADAMPLWGIGPADILVEFVVESVATRLLAVYQDISGAGRIGGIRSLRSSSMEIAASFDAIFTHWGGRSYDNVVASGEPVTSFGTIDAASLGSRDSSKVAPNNAIVNSGNDLMRGLPATFRPQHYEGFKQGFNFTDVGTPINGFHADTVTVGFSDRTTKKTTFSYDFYKGKYFVSQFGTDLIDGNTGEKLSFTNILVVQTNMQFDINESGHTYIRTTGTGTGYFINGRKAIPIMWARSDLSSPYTYFQADGTPLSLGVGKTYICMVDSNQIPQFS